MKFTCPCCGYKTFDREDHLWDICEVCFWQSCPIQNVDPYSCGGPNGGSLIEAQRNFVAYGACEERLIPSVRPPVGDEIKDENWQLIVPKIQHFEGKLHLKRHWNETTGQPLTDSWGTSFYYFETNKECEVLRQIEVYENGKVLKYSDAYLEDEFGGLAEKPLDLNSGDYLICNTIEFYELWKKPVSNEFLIEQIYVSDKWHVGCNNLKYNQSEAELKSNEVILTLTLDHRFMLDLTYEDNAKYVLKIKEGNTWIHFFNYPLWHEAATATNKFLSEIEAAAKTIDVRKAEEEKQFEVRVSIDNAVVMAKLTTWRNMDWDVEKFRNIQIEIRDEIFSIIDTFTDFENMLIALQKSLPENYKMEMCFFCRFSAYMPAGNDNFGDLDCFKNCKSKFIEADEKLKLIEVYRTEKERIEKVEETHYCEEFKPYNREDWVYKHQIK
jgi:Cysteine-rich CPCC